MSNAVFPTLPGLKWGIKKMPQWSTRAQKSASGRELRGSFYSFPIWHFSLSFEVLRAGTAFQEIQTLIGFFNARRGSFDTFLYEDPDENTVTNQLVVSSTTAGVKKYQLVKPYGGFVEPIGAVKGTPTIRLNGIVQDPSTYVITDLGEVDFNSPPAAGQTLSWTGSYYYRVRFKKDEEEFEQFMKDLWQASRIEFQSVKP